MKIIIATWLVLLVTLYGCEKNSQSKCDMDVNESNEVKKNSILFIGTSLRLFGGFDNQFPATSHIPEYHC